MSLELEDDVRRLEHRIGTLVDQVQRLERRYEMHRHGLRGFPITEPTDERADRAEAGQ